MKIETHYYDNDANEVEESMATHMQILTLNDEGKCVDSFFSYFDNYVFKIIGPILTPSETLTD